MPRRLMPYSILGPHFQFRQVELSAEKEFTRIVVRGRYQLA